MTPDEQLGAEFLRISRREFQQSLAKIEKAVARLAPDQLWFREHENENAIGNLLLHLAGNVRQWVVSGVGGAPDKRDRGAEFAQRDAIGVDTVLGNLREAVAEADAALERLPPGDLVVHRHIQTYDVTLMHAIYHCVEHFGQHTGQILWAVKHVTGEDLAFYAYLKEEGPQPEEREP